MNDFFRDKHLQSNPYLNWFELFAVLVTLWIVLSEIFTPKFLLFGIASSAVISFYCLKAFRIGGLKTKNTYFIFHVNPFKFLAYFLWLLKEIIKAALDTTKVIFSGRKALHPQICWFKADYDNPVARALLANSITLTPGTVTIDIYDDGVFSVHALNDSFREGLMEGTMQKKIAALYHEEIDFGPVEVVRDPSYAKPEPAQLVSNVFRVRRRSK